MANGNLTEPDRLNRSASRDSDLETLTSRSLPACRQFTGPGPTGSRGAIKGKRSCHRRYRWKGPLKCHLVEMGPRAAGERWLRGPSDDRIPRRGIVPRSLSSNHRALSFVDDSKCVVIRRQRMQGGTAVPCISYRRRHSELRQKSL